MAFPDQNVTPTKVATGHLIFRYGTGAGTVVGPVREITDIETGETLYEHKGYNATGGKQNVALFLTELGSGKLRITVDEVYDIDSVAWKGDAIAYPSLSQNYPKNPTRCWEWYAATAYINILSMKPGIDTPTTTVFEVIPYANPGTAAWAFNADAAAPPANH